MRSQLCFLAKYRTTSMWPLKAVTYKGVHWRCTQRHKYIHKQLNYCSTVPHLKMLWHLLISLACPLHSWTSLEVLAASQFGCCMQQSVPLSSHTENGEIDVMVIVLWINRRWHNTSVLCSPPLQQEQGLSLWQHIWLLPHLQWQLLWGSGCVM